MLARLRSSFWMVTLVLVLAGWGCARVGVGAASDPLLADLQKQVVLAGSVTFDTGSKTTYDSRLTFPKRRVQLQLDNRSSLAITLGDDVVFLEASQDLRKRAGALIMTRQPHPEEYLSVIMAPQDCRHFAVPDFEKRFPFYDLPNALIAGSDSAHNLGTNFYSDDYKDDCLTRHLTRNRSAPVMLTVRLGIALETDELQVVRLVFNEATVVDDEKTRRFFVVAHFKREKDNLWQADRLEWTPIEPAPLLKIVAADDSDAYLRVLAANMLSKHFPDQFETPVRNAALKAGGGHPLAEAAVTLFLQQELAGLETVALALLKDADQDQGSRWVAADYLVQRRTPEAVVELARVAHNADYKIFWMAERCVRNLGQYRSEAATKALVALAKKTGDSLNPGDEAFAALAASGRPEAIAQLKAWANDAGNGKDVTRLRTRSNNALRASEIKESFPEIARLARDETTEESQRKSAILQLANFDTPQSIGLLLDLLKNDKPLTDASSYRMSPAVTALRKLDSAQAIGPLKKLAEMGNLYALQALAGMHQEAVNPILGQRLRAAIGDNNEIAMELTMTALAENFPKQNARIFKSALRNKKMVAQAVQGIARSGDAQAFDYLWALRKDEKHQYAATRALHRFPFQKHQDRYLQHVLEGGYSSQSFALRMIQEGWRDETTIPQLLNKMQDEEKPEYSTVMLLRHLAGWPMGPDTWWDWIRDDSETKWKEQWCAWGRENGHLK